MGRALDIRDDLGAHELPGWARKAGNGRASARAYAIANALNGLKRAAAARLAGWNAKGCATRWCATTPRVLRAFTTGRRGARRGVWTRPRRRRWRR